MLNRVEAFEMLHDKIKMREPFTATLVAEACSGTVAGYLTLEHWVIAQQYAVKIKNGSLIYESSMMPVKRKVPA